jgi:hypothetical protein
MSNPDDYVTIPCETCGEPKDVHINNFKRGIGLNHPHCAALKRADNIVKARSKMKVIRDKQVADIVAAIKADPIQIRLSERKLAKKYNCGTKLIKMVLNQLIKELGGMWHD